MLQLLQRFARTVRQRRPIDYPRDFSPEDIALFEGVRPFTMTTPERILSLANAVGYVTAAEVPGAIVECGVWAGGSMMAAARTLLSLGADDRELFLFDTFEGMSAPTEHDLKFNGEPAAPRYELVRTEHGSDWCHASIGWVTKNMALTGYPAERIHYVKGMVEQTIPGPETPEQIAILRLDTDFYESTRHELVHLYPRLASGGVLIIDDYGDWQGARRAVDEWMLTLDRPLLLNRIDATGRIACKP